MQPWGALQAVRELPSGQAAPLVRFVAVSASGLAAMTAIQQAALAEVRWLHVTSAASSASSRQSTSYLLLFAVHTLHLRTGLSAHLESCGLVIADIASE